MNYTVLIDWKFVVALGATAVGIIFAVKMDADAAERVSTHVVDSLSAACSRWKQRLLGFLARIVGLRPKSQ